MSRNLQWDLSIGFIVLVLTEASFILTDLFECKRIYVETVTFFKTRETCGTGKGKDKCKLHWYKLLNYI